MNKTRIAVAGAGYIGRAHIDALLSSHTCELSAIVDPSPAAGAIAARAIASAACASGAGSASVPIHPTLEALFKHDRPDGVVLATPNQLHVPHAMQAFEARMPMLLEKPVAPTIAEARDIVRAGARAGVPILVGHHRAHSPIMARAREVVASGVLGRLVAVTGTALFMKPDHYFDEAPWRREPGGGPMLLNMIHEVHNLRMLCGDIVAVQAFASNAVRRFPVEDTVAINLRFGNGVLGTFLLSDTAASARSWEQTSRENAAYPAHDDEDCYLLAGTNGSLAIPTMRLKTYPRPEDRSWWKPFDISEVDLDRDDPIRRQMEHFGAVVRGEAAPLVTANDGLRNLLVTDAIVRAASSAHTIDIPID